VAVGQSYGETVDTSDPNFGRLTDDRAIIQQWVELCLQTVQGLLWSSPETGGSLRKYLLVGLTDVQLAGIPHQVAAALESDERIARADVSITSSTRTTMTLGIEVYPKGSTGAPYQFTASVSHDLVSVQLAGGS
jgi:hypothetical protein